MTATPETLTMAMIAIIKRRARDAKNAKLVRSCERLETHRGSRYETNDLISVCAAWNSNYGVKS